MDDLISRHAAVDALREIEFSHYMEFGEYIGEDTREVRLIRAEKAQDTIEQLPSAQPEIIRCKDCKYYGYNECFHGRGLTVAFDNTFCSYAESIREVKG